MFVNPILNLLKIPLEPLQLEKKNFLFSPQSEGYTISHIFFNMTLTPLNSTRKESQHLLKLFTKPHYSLNRKSNHTQILASWYTYKINLTHNPYNIVASQSLFIMNFYYHFELLALDINVSIFTYHQYHIVKSAKPPLEHIISIVKIDFKQPTHYCPIK